MRKLSNLFLIVTSITAGFLLVEMLVRIFDVAPRPMASLPIRSYQLSANPVLRYEYVPGYRSAKDYFDASHKGFVINSHGFRDFEYTQTKPDGTFRILVIGDSTTAGNGIPDLKKTYTKILEDELNALDSTGTVFEVLNMGVGGYQTLQEVEMLRARGLAYDPDLVFVTICANDFDLHADGGLYKRLKRLEQDPADGVNPTLLGSIFRKSRLAFIIYYRFGGGPEIDLGDRWYTETALQGRSTVKAGLERLSELQQSRGFSVRALVLPTFRVPFGVYDSVEYHDRVRNAAADLPGIAVIDLLEEFSIRFEDPTPLSYDGLHMNEKGHRLMAELLLPVVRRIADESRSH